MLTTITAAAMVAVTTPPVGAVTSVVIAGDTDRDGRVDLERDLAGRGDWTAERGAIFLPNLDDDAQRCTVSGSDLTTPDPAIDHRISACNDAQDDVVNGDADAADLAPLRTAPGAAPGARVELARGQQAYARLWAYREGRWVSLGAGGSLTQGEVSDGATLGVEGRDVVRDRTWDGLITVSLISGDATDRVRMRVAPLVLQNDLRRPETVLTSNNPGRDGYPEFRAGLKRAMEAAGLPSGALTLLGTKDPWIQDIMEPATVSMPGPDGPRVMRLLLRSANYGRHMEDGLRIAGRALFAQLRGRDVGVVQQYTASRPPSVDDSLNSTGNFDSLPPFEGFPLGRPLYGSVPSRTPDPAFAGMVDAQFGSDPVRLDTSWLVVGHVDETTHVIPTRSARGWTLVVADPRLAVGLLREAVEAGKGSARLFEGTSERVKPTVREALADKVLMADQETAAKAIDAQVDTLTRATGLSRSELVRVPVLYAGFNDDQLASAPQARAAVAAGRTTDTALAALADRMRSGRAAPRMFIARTASIPNGISLGDGVLASPDPHGPVADGVDLFKAAAERAVSPHPVRLSWVEDWDFLHRGGGEVHCGTNALRVPTRADWWAAAR